jgi:hypothetical protein
MQLTGSRPPSPSGISRMRQGNTSAISSPTRTPTSTPTSELSDPVDVPSKEKEKQQPMLEIVVTSDVLCLRGPGTEVEPALLSGNVVLYLPEDTDIKGITLHFRGKARLPPTSDP